MAIRKCVRVGGGGGGGEGGSVVHADVVAGVAATVVSVVLVKRVLSTRALPQEAFIRRVLDMKTLHAYSHRISLHKNTLNWTRSTTKKYATLVGWQLFCVYIYVCNCIYLFAPFPGRRNVYINTRRVTRL